EGAQLEGKGDVLWYGWCDQACTDPASWQRYLVGLNTNNGQEPDLELDAAGRPRIAYALYDQAGLGYGWCDSACETTAGQWQHRTVESGEDLAALWPVAHPPHCDGGFWQGLTPTLALDKSGNALIGYDATYYARCWYKVVTNEWEIFHQFSLVKRTAR